jgi:N-acetylmuramoyl-L-alanine amidase
MAEIMQKELIKGTKGYDRKLLNNPSIYVIKNTKMPAILTECLFMSNPDDMRALLNNDNLDRIAEHIAIGIENCLDALP